MSIINKRRSTRRFSVKKVEREKLFELASAGLSAPSSKNKMPWEMIIVDDRKILQQCSEVHNNWKLLQKAPAIIVVCGDLTKDDREAQLIMTCAAATENILLRAVEVDLGTVWLGAYPDQTRIEHLKKALDLPEELVPMSVIVVGYKEETEEKMRTLDRSKIYINKWGRGMNEYFEG